MRVADPGRLPEVVGVYVDVAAAGCVAVGVGGCVLVGVKVAVAAGGGVAVWVGVDVGLLALWVCTISCGAFAPASRLAKLIAVLPGTVSAKL